MDSRRMELLRRAGCLCLTTAFALSAGCIAQPEPADEAVGRQSERVTVAPPSKVTLRAKIRRSSDVVDVEVSASQPFPDSAKIPALVIGDQVFASSRHPADGRTDTLIFNIDRALFEALPDAGEVSVGYVSPSARLTPGTRTGLAALRTPDVSLAQLHPARAKVGKLAKGSLEVLP